MIKRHLANQVRRLLKGYPAVALLGARLTIAGVLPGKLGKQAASQWAAEVGLEAGTRLGEP
ncbi:MAG: hypothetical protein HGA84_03695 [Syntrophobacteraceae bacterium]|nr:hypothetical protein [Syntrophobacteraceae bacterium]